MMILFDLSVLGIVTVRNEEKKEDMHEDPSDHLEKPHGEKDPRALRLP